MLWLQLLYYIIWLQVVASEAEGLVSRSEKRQVALKTAKTGVSRLVTPRNPLPLEISHVEKLMLWLDWTRTFNRLPITANPCIILL